jgi:hypothetical protein
MTIHAINAMAGLGEHKLVDTVVTGTTFEAVRVIRVVAGHNGLVEDGLMADAAVVWAVWTDRLAVREEKEIGIGGDSVMTLGALEAVDMKKRLTR